MAQAAPRAGTRRQLPLFLERPARGTRGETQSTRPRAQTGPQDLFLSPFFLSRSAVCRWGEVSRGARWYVEVDRRGNHRRLEGGGVLVVAGEREKRAREREKRARESE